LARAAAKDGRRVALVDLWIDEPQLAAAAGLPAGAGIVDVFQSGDDLTAAAQQIDGVFFIGAGTHTAAPEFILAHPRWKKLHAGFRTEDALLLLYMPAGVLAHLSTVPDAVIALAPEGVSLDSPAAAGLVAVQGVGANLLGVVRERWTPAGMPVPPAALRPVIPVPAPRAPSRRRGLVAAAALAVAILGAAAWVVFAGSPPAPPSHGDTASTRTAPVPAATPAEPRDTLGWTVQLAAYGTLDNALAHADRLADEDVTAFVTPVEATRAVWYRVLVGAFPSRDSAAAARSDLWKRDLARSGEGELLRAPYSLQLAANLDPDSLRRAGVPAVRLRRGDRPVIGAFETPEQAVLAQTQLQRAGIVASLIARMETTP
jgi:cell division septation protein DedD